MRILQIINLLLFSLFYYTIDCQEINIDSLLSNYNKNDALKDSLYKDLLLNISYYYSIQSSDSSLFYSDELIAISESTKDNYYCYKGYLQRGNYFRKEGNLQKAYNTFLISAEYASKTNNLRNLGFVYATLGDTYSTARDHKNSINYYNKAIDILKKDSISIALATVLLNTGGEYLYSGNYIAASKLFEESLHDFEILEHPIGIAYNLGNLGRIHSVNKEYSIAEDKLLKAISILKKYGDNYAIIAYKIRLAKIYQIQEFREKALILCNEAYILASQSGYKPQMRDASERLALIYNDLGDYKKAYHYQSQYIAYRDSINNDETVRKMADLRTEYEVAQKQIEVEKAQTLLELETKRRQNQQIVGAGLMIVILLSGALSYVLFRTARRDRYVNKLLREQKEELMAQRDMLEDVNNTKDRFFSIISHDLRGPIGVLNGTTMLIREFLKSKDYSQLNELTSNMEYSVKKVQNLLDNLLDWAISQRGQYNCVAEKVELNEVMSDTISIFSDIAQAKNIELSYEQKFSEAYITADRHSLSTILRNLISNALKFTNKGGAVDIIVEKKNTETQIFIKDTGVGIPQDKIKTIFNIEAKKSTWGTDKEKGLGIGLNLVYEFVKMNKGEIQVFSTPNSGTTFIVTFSNQNELANKEKAQLI